MLLKPVTAIPSMKNLALTPLALSLLLSACASNPAQTSEDRKILRDTLARRSALVTSGCVTRNQFGDDLLLTEASARMAERMRTESLTHLASAGLRPAKSAAVLLCSGHTTGESPGFLVKPNRDTDATQPAQYPMALDPSIKADPALAAAYDALFRAVVVAAKPASGEADDVRQPKALGITARDLELIRTHASAERLWVVNGSTGMVSFAKSFLTGMATGLASAVTFGVGYVAQPVNASAYQVNLVDLGSGQRLWRGQLEGPGRVDLSGEIRAAKPEQLAEWAETLYAPLIATSSTIAAPVETSVSAPQAAPVAAPIAGPEATPSPAVAAVARQAAPANGQTRTLTRAVLLRLNPKTDGAVAATLSADSTVQLTGSTQAASGLWWYVKAGPRSGWVAHADLLP